MARVPYVSRDEMDAEGQQIYDTIREDRNAAEVGLQFRALLNSPKAAGFLTSLGTQLRFNSTMPDNLKELAIIMLAREWNSDLEWTGHSVMAKNAGLSADSIEKVRTWKATELVGDEAVIVKFVNEMLHDKNVSDETFAATHNILGDRATVELALTVGYYCAIDLAQIALRPEMEPGRVSTL